MIRLFLFPVGDEAPDGEQKLSNTDSFALENTDLYEMLQVRTISPCTYCIILMKNCLIATFYHSYIGWRKTSSTYGCETGSIPSLRVIFCFLSRFNQIATLNKGGLPIMY